MYCKHCGHEIDDDSTFCKACGKSQIESDVVAAQEDQIDKPDVQKTRKKKPHLLLGIIAIILVGVIIVVIIPKEKKGFLYLHEGMTKSQVHYSLGYPLYADPDYESYEIYDFYGHTAKAGVFYDDNGKLSRATATINQIDIAGYDSIFESICETMGKPLYYTDSADTAYPDAEWNLSTSKYHKYIHMSFGSGECEIYIDR